MEPNAGQAIAHYRVVARIGETGTVYKAEDTNSGRTVALKFLPKEVPGGSASAVHFHQTGRAMAGLNQPHIATVYEVGEWEGRSFWAVALPAGESLAQRLANRPIDLRDLLDLGVQMVDALNAAHSAGIVHGRLQPAVVFVTRQGDVQVTDFGLIGLAAGTAADGGCEAPEQVRGEQPDARADLFSLGTILYQMATGEMPFAGNTPEAVRQAILEREPIPPSRRNPDLPARFDEILSKALEKDRELRYQSAAELRADLRRLRRDWDSERVAATRAALAVSAPVTAQPGAESSVQAVPESVPTERKWGKVLGLAAALFLAAAVGAVAVRLLRHPGPPLPEVFQPLTFQQGRVDSARFGAGGNTVYYTARWNGGPPQVYSVNPGSPESAPLGLKDAEVLSVSRGGDLAVLMNLHLEAYGRAEGNLLAVSLGRGARRPILQTVEEADWSPSGEGVAVVRRVGGMDRLEYPIGTVLTQTRGWIGEPRFSPDGKRIAFIEHPQRGNDAGSVVVVDLSGKSKVLSAGWEIAGGLAWSPKGNDLWFTAGRRGMRQLYAVGLSGHITQLLSVAGSLRLEDIAEDGRVLLAREDSRREIAEVNRGKIGERTLSWLDDSELRDVSADGKIILFNEAVPAGGSENSVYIRGTDGSAATRLGQGRALALSPDGRFALTKSQGSRSHFVLLPVGSGTPVSLPPAAVSAVWAAWLPGGKQFVFLGRQLDKGLQLFIQNVSGGPPQAISPSGLGGSAALSPDGKRVAAIGQDGKGYLYPVAGGQVATFGGLTKGDRLLGWSRYGSTIFVAEGGLPAKVYGLSLASGAKTLLYQLAPSRPDGVVRIGAIRITSDGRLCLFSYRRLLSHLFLAEGLR